MSDVSVAFVRWLLGVSDRDGWQRIARVVKPLCGLRVWWHVFVDPGPLPLVIPLAVVSEPLSSVGMFVVPVVVVCGECLVLGLCPCVVGLASRVGPVCGVVVAGGEVVVQEGTVMWPVEGGLWCGCGGKVVVVVSSVARLACYGRGRAAASRVAFALPTMAAQWIPKRGVVGSVAVGVCGGWGGVKGVEEVVSVWSVVANRVGLASVVGGLSRASGVDASS